MGTHKKKTQPVSALGYALLSFLARGPHTGYELANILNSAARMIWSAPHSQIYPELRRLTLTGYTTFAKVQQAERPDKKVYTITTAGKEVLRSWLTETPEPEPSRSQAIIQAHALWLAGTRESVEWYARHAKGVKQEIEDLEQSWLAYRKRLKVPKDLDATSPHFATFAVFSYAIATRKAIVAWCYSMTRALESTPAKRSLAGGIPVNRRER